MYSSPPIGVLWLVVLTVPAGQVAEETVIEEEEEAAAEKLPLTKKPRIEEMPDSVEESKVVFSAVCREEKGKSQSRNLYGPSPSLSFCPLCVIWDQEVLLGGDMTRCTFTGRHGKRAPPAAAPGGQSASPGVPAPAAEEGAGGRAVPPQAGGHGPAAAQRRGLRRGGRGGRGGRCSCH